MTKKIDSKRTKKMQKKSKGPYVEDYVRGKGDDSEGYRIRVRLPNKKKGEMFGIADQLLGGARIKVMCADGNYRMGRIPGKYRKRMWVRSGDLVIVQPWSFQDEKAEIIWRYTSTQARYLRRKKLLPAIFSDIL